MLLESAGFEHGLFGLALARRRWATWVLDASALIAFLREEPGADLVEETLLEALTSRQSIGLKRSASCPIWQKPESVSRRLEDEGILGTALEVRPVDEQIARRIAELRPSTRKAGLSLGDRACLALASQLKLGALTADRAWAELDLDIEVKLIR